MPVCAVYTSALSVQENFVCSMYECLCLFEPAGALCMPLCAVQVRTNVSAVYSTAHTVCIKQCVHCMYAMYACVH